MIVLQAVWQKSRLHLWAEVPTDASPSPAPIAGPPAEFNRRSYTQVASHEQLRARLGDLWDSLLISDAQDSELTLRLPYDGSGFPSSMSRLDLARSDAIGNLMPLLGRQLDTLAFAPADAVDVLTSTPAFAHADVSIGSSLKFWSRAAELVLELLAMQRFVPAIHDAGGDRVRGYWRAVVQEPDVSDRLRKLISAMPPVCRTAGRDGSDEQASALIEDFLRSTVDALVRRILEGDELAHPLRDTPDDRWPPEMRWLRSLVSEDATLRGTPEGVRRVLKTVQGWLAKLEPATTERPFRTCFRLHTPPRADESVRRGPPVSWRLSIHIQSSQDASIVMDAARLVHEPPGDPAILKRTFVVTEEQIRADLAGAAVHFPPLAVCAQANGPLECTFSIADAYHFLRDAAPVLEREGFGVWLPRWWRDDRPKLRMRMDLRPADHASAPSQGMLPLEAVVAYDWRVALGDEDLSLEEISELAASKEALVQVRGKWTEVRPHDLQTAMDFLRRNGDGSSSLVDALRRFYLVDDQETGLPVSSLRASGWVERLLSATDFRETYQPIPQPAAFRGELRHYQTRGLAWLAFLTKHGLGACLADDMGLGKTIQMIALWLQERESEERPGPTLLVVPMSLVGNWRRELEKFAPTMKVMVHHGTERLTGREFVAEVGRFDVVISTYGLTHRDFEHLAGVDWQRIVLDEAQNIKNPAAKQSAALRALRAKHRIALTGTPVENRLSELWSILDFLNPGYLSTANDFRRRFAVPIERLHDDDRAQRLRCLIRPFVLRRRKDDPEILPDLPDKMEMKVYCNLTREQAALYEAVVNDMLTRVDASGGIQRRGLILATLVKLKQVCNHPTHFLGDGSSLPHRSGKCDRITEMLDEVVAEGHRALVFTQFREMGELLKKLLEECLDRPVLFLHGGTTQKGRDQMVEQFQDPAGVAPVFLLSLKAGGLGLNLTAANHVFHFDRWWNPAVENQATDRAHRIGQVKQVQVHKFICIGTLEERIDAIIEHKRGIAENIVGGGEDWLTELSTDSLREILTLSREAVSEE